MAPSPCWRSAIQPRIAFVVLAPVGIETLRLAGTESGWYQGKREFGVVPMQMTPLHVGHGKRRHLRKAAQVLLTLRLL